LDLYRDKEKIIVSNDKDFIQILGDKTIIYRPSQSEVLNKDRVVVKYGIHPKNFVLARAMVGDKSDNIEGIRGVGLTSLAKRLSFLAEDKTYFINEVMDYCREIDSKIKIYNSILENETLIRKNYKLMQLHAPALSYQSKKFVEYNVENFEYNMNKSGFLVKTKKLGFGSYDWADLWTGCKSIIDFNKTL
jgi:5'-3' exonuclease